MRFTTNVAAVRIIAAAVFIAAAGLLVQSFAEGEQESVPASAKAMAAAGEAGLSGILPAPVKVRTVKVPAPEAGPDTPSVPDGSDPRWAKSAHAGPVIASPVPLALPAQTTALASLQETDQGFDGMPMITGSTSGNGEAGLTGSEGDDAERFEVDIDVVAAAARDFTVEKAPAKRTTRTTSDVKLRARGSNAANVIGVIPRGSEVAVVRCSSWCEVSFEGKRGWVYSGFVSGYQGRRQAASRAAPASEKATAQAAAEAKPRNTLASRLFGNPEKAPETGVNE